MIGTTIILFLAIISLCTALTQVCIQFIKWHNSEGFDSLQITIPCWLSALFFSIFFYLTH